MDAACCGMASWEPTPPRPFARSPRILRIRLPTIRTHRNDASLAAEQPDEADETPSRRHGVPDRWRRVRIRAPGVSQLIRVLGRLVRERGKSGILWRVQTLEPPSPSARLFWTLVLSTVGSFAIQPLLVVALKLPATVVMSDMRL